VEFHKEITKNITMKKLYTFIICLGFLQMAFGQVTTNYNAKWFFGVNTGLTWQSTDVSNKTNTGWGLTLGKTFNYHEGAIFSFDIRGRFLRGFWYGQDRKTSDFGVPNVALSQGATNYKDTLGYAVRNFQTENYLLNLEFVIHANRLRERTRWDAYIFGGIGLNWKQTYGDYLNRDQTTGDLSMYNWDVNNLSRSNIKSTQDGVYETALDGSNQNSFNFFTSKSLGFGLGYQVAKAITIGVEHKTTITNVDDFDGVVKNGTRENDIYHYTNAFIRFRLFGRSKDEVVVDPKNEYLPPVVEYTQPNVSGTVVNNPNYTVQGRIKNVFDKENVIFTMGGVRMDNFSYNTKSDLFAANVTLVEGQNTLILTGNNQYGTDTKTTIIIYKPEVILPPVVSFINPSVSPTTVSDGNYNLVGNVLNVKDKSGVKVVFNGTSRSDFNFNTINGNVTISLALNPGSNIVQITGTNSAGTDSKQTSIIYNRVEPTKVPPVVYFTDPSSSPVTTGNNTYTLRGKVQNVTNQSGVNFTQNGSTKSNFTFNPTTNDFTYSATLNLDQNTFVLTGTNSDGSASATTVIIYKRTVVNPPVVNIYNPNGSSTTVSVSQYAFGGSVSNITSQSQATLKVNGSNVSNFNFNSTTGAVTTNLNLIQGANTVQLTGTNADGTDSKQVTIIYTPIVNVPKPPVVTITNPGGSSANVSLPQFPFIGYVQNVSTRSQVSMTVNGGLFNGFNFNTSTGMVTADLTLVSGANNIQLTGTNSDGTDYKQTTIVYTPVNTVIQPVVYFTTPSNSPTTVNNGSYTLKGKVMNVDGSQNVTFKQNGVVQSNFTYNASSDEFSSTVNLSSGQNYFELIGTNTAGSASANTIINFAVNVPQPKPPVVTISNPSGSSTNVSLSQFAFVGNIQNVTTRSQVSMLLNGNLFNGFSFNATTGVVTGNLTLVSGANTVELKGTNADGSDQKQVSIIYTPVVVINPPVVNFVNPSSNPTSVSNASYNVQATITNVSTPSGVNIKHNGNDVSVFTFGSGNLSFNLNLNEGANVINVSGTNTSGMDTKTTTIVYTKPLPVVPPVVTFVNPTSSGSAVTAPNYNVRATVLNVSGPSDIQVKVNGSNTSSFSYSTSTKLVTLILDLQEGSNTIEVKGTNSAGNDVKTTVISYKPAPCDAPVISPIMPSSETYSTDKATMTLTASVSGVTSASQITLKPFGGRGGIAFEFNSITRTITATINLNVGLNSIVLEASNNCGSVQTNFNITRTACEGPNLSLNFANVGHNQSSYAPNVTLVLDVQRITSSSQVNVTMNGKGIASTFSLVNGTVEVDYGILVGTSTFVVTVTNSCGSKSYTHTVTRIKSPTKNRPTVSITDPATSPASVSGTTYQLKFSTTEIIDQAEIIVRVNGVIAPVSFSKTTNSGSAVLKLNAPTNNVVVTVTNPVGTATSSTVIVTTGKASSGGGETTPKTGRGGRGGR
jgi:hypothetical protein